MKQLLKQLSVVVICNEGVMKLEIRREWLYKMKPGDKRNMDEMVLHLQFSLMSL